MDINVVKLGTVSYASALEIQHKLHEKRKANEIGNTLLLLEHKEVITLGTRGQYSNIYLSDDELQTNGIDVIEVDRGGDVTYHGPGQIVGYPIFDLHDFDKDIRKFITCIEQGMIKLLAHEYGISAYTESGKYTGIWVDNKKITAIGIAVKKWVTLHGFAFNVNTNLDHFKWINPCGLSRGVASIESLTGKRADMDKLFDLTAQYLAKEFECNIVNTSIDELLNEV